RPEPPQRPRKLAYGRRAGGPPSLAAARRRARGLARRARDAAHRRPASGGLPGVLLAPAPAHAQARIGLGAAAPPRPGAGPGPGPVRHLDLGQSRADRAAGGRADRARAAGRRGHRLARGQRRGAGRPVRRSAPGLSEPSAVTADALSRLPVSILPALGVAPGRPVAAP